jgi:hypothetical protein
MIDDRRMREATEVDEAADVSNRVSSIFLAFEFEEINQQFVKSGRMAHELHGTSTNQVAPLNTHTIAYHQKASRKPESSSSVTNSPRLCFSSLT